MPDRPLSRRTFLAGTTTAAAGAALAPGLAALASQAKPILKVGLVGCGGRGTGAAYNALLAEDGTVALTAMGDVFADRLDAALAHLVVSLGEAKADRVQVDEAHRFVGFDAYRKVIESDVDVVLLATPPGFRPEHLRAAVDAGKHVFTEKPVAVDAPGVRSVLESVRKAKVRGLALVSGFCWRYKSGHRAAFERLRSGGIGELHAFYSTYLASPLGTHPRRPGWTDMEWQLRNWQHFLWLGGDHVVEQAVHSIDKQSWAFGDEPPLACVAVGGRQARTGPESGDIYDHFSVTYDYADGRRAFHVCRQMPSCAFDNSDFAYGTKGRLTINGWGPLYLIEGEQPWEYDGEHNDMYQQEHDELFASLRAGAPKNDGDFMATSTMLAIMGRMAAYTGRVISWEEALASEQRLGPAEWAFGDLAVGEVAVPGTTRFF